MAMWVNLFSIPNIEENYSGEEAINTWVGTWRAKSSGGELGEVGGELGEVGEVGGEVGELFKLTSRELMNIMAS